MHSILLISNNKDDLLCGDLGSSANLAVSTLPLEGKILTILLCVLNPGQAPLRQGLGVDWLCSLQLHGPSGLAPGGKAASWWTALLIRVTCFRAVIQV